MCGISGIYRFDGKAVKKRDIAEQINCIHHRGPDGDGIFLKKHLGLGHVRLSIIELSEYGSQPMTFDDENYALSYNGETYNFEELKASISEDISYSGGSDTEVILHGLIRENVEFIKRMEGMFAFAFYDVKKDELLIARDPFGIKPLYYHQTSSRVVFCSEIKPILLNNEVKAIPNEEAIKEHLVLGYAMEPNTAFKEVYKLPGGSLMRINQSGVTIEKYWDISELLDSSKSNFEELFHQSVLMHTKSDVPLGMFLSGGFDSNIILQSLHIQGKVNKGFKAFNVGYNEEGHENMGNLASERSIAKLSAKKFNAELIEINVQNQEEKFISFPEAIKIVEEPVCNPSNILIDFITKIAKEKGNKVLLSGHGGDEIFGGYRRYVAIKNLKYLRNPFGRLLLRLARKKIGENLYFRLIKATEKGNTKPHFDLISLGTNMIQNYDCLGSFVKESDLDKMRTKIDHIIQPFKRYSLLKQMMILDFLTYLSAQNLINMDKFSMKNSVEVRVPFLNRPLVAYGLSLKDNELVKGFRNKLVVRNFAKKVLPKEIQKTKKSGFSPSLINLALSSEGTEILFNTRTFSRGIIQPDKIRRFLEKKSDITESDAMVILNYIYIEQWHRTFIDNKE